MSRRNQPSQGEWFVDDKNHIYAKAEYIAHPFKANGVDYSDHFDGLVALPYGTETGTQSANARLIAAAPDLLTACEALLRIHYDEGKASLKGLQATNLADAAIAKAKGTP